MIEIFKTSINFKNMENSYNLEINNPETADDPEKNRCHIPQ